MDKMKEGREEGADEAGKQRGPRYDDVSEL